MKPSVPAWISRVAIVVGIALFGVTLLFIDRAETLREARQLGLLLPIVLLPGAAWHMLRTLGWLICFPAGVRPSYWRLFRVRLAADAVSYFTIRGVASEPLRVVLLLGRVPAAASTASTILERTAMGIVSVTLVAGTATAAITSDIVPDDWQRIFLWIAIGAIIIVTLVAIFLTREGRYLGPLFEAMYRRTGWGWTEGRVARFIRDVERLFLDLARSDPTRVRNLVLLGVACYALMTLEVWL